MTLSHRALACAYVCVCECVCAALCSCVIGRMLVYMCGRAMRFSRCFELSAEDKWMEDVPKKCNYN